MFSRLTVALIRTEARLPNTFAYVALFAWPAVCIMLFVLLPVEAAAVWSLLGGYLLLPAVAVVKVQLLPSIDKSSVPALTTYLLCLMKGTGSPRPRVSILVYLAAFFFVICPIFTSMDNSYELHIGDRSIPGFYPVDALKLAAQNILTLAPFFVGMRYLSSDKGRSVLLRAIPISALFYSIPMLLEVRLSPQLQRLIYGGNPAGFITLARGGGYRPLVFLNNGLELALFTALALIAALVAMRCRWKLLRLPSGAVATYLGVLLLLCKTLGALIYAAIAAPLLLFCKPHTWVKVSCVIGLVILAYPMLRTYDIVPVRRVAATASSLSAERGGSFQFRVANEDQLLAKANQKPLFGWGTWGRNRIYDQESGNDLSITDGAWIIRYGMFGWVGYLALFGLFAASTLNALSSVKGPVTASTLVSGGLALMLAINLVDAIPNANVVPLTFVLAGSIAARARPRVRQRLPSLRDPTADLRPAELVG